MFQRLHLTRPIDGTYIESPVRILDVSATGAMIEGLLSQPPGTRGTLRFVWRGRVVEIQAEVTRAADSESGLHFLQDNEVLRELIAQSAAEVLRAQQANLQGNRESNLVGDETLTAASAGLRGKGFVTWTLEDKEWKKRQSLLPDQPPNGFTVSATEPPEQVEMLRLTWERGDEAARNMTRLLAELSASQLIRKK